MARILIAWELGGNYGHLGRQLPIAEALCAAGHDVLFAACDNRVATQVLTPRKLAFVQAPVFASATRFRRPPATYAELLLAEGYADADSLHGRVSAWLRLFQIWGAEALIVDHSPTALLAARIASLPAVQVGNGFEIPPNTTPLPIIRDWEQIDPRRVERSESRALDTVNAVLSRAGGGSRLMSLSELFTWSEQILATFRELDQFPERIGASYAGALFGELAVQDVNAQGDGEVPRNGSAGGRRIFAYLHNGVPGLRALIQALTVSGARATCVVPQLRASSCAQLSTETLTVASDHRPLGRILSESDLVVSTGGIGLLSQTLLCAIPVLLLPSTVEQYLVARRVQQSGAGLTVGNDRRAAVLAGGIERLLNEPRFRGSAAEFASRYAGFRPRSVATRVVATVHRLLDAAT